MSVTSWQRGWIIVLRFKPNETGILHFPCSGSSGTTLLPLRFSKRRIRNSKSELAHWLYNHTVVLLGPINGFAYSTNSSINTGQAPTTKYFNN